MIVRAKRLQTGLIRLMIKDELPAAALPAAALLTAALLAAVPAVG
jgi:hypothetical protein